jgi:hypothetical protein
MHSQLSSILARTRQQEPRDQAARQTRPERQPHLFAPLTVRLATAGDRTALQRLAALDDTSRPVAPVLIGAVLGRPVAALSLADGKVIVDPFTPTGELVQLLRLRARQMGAGRPGSGRALALPSPRTLSRRHRRRRAARSSGTVVAEQLSRPRAAVAPPSR